MAAPQDPPVPPRIAVYLEGWWAGAQAPVWPRMPPEDVRPCAEHWWNLGVAHGMISRAVARQAGVRAGRAA